MHGVTMEITMKIMCVCFCNLHILCAILSSVAYLAVLHSSTITS